MESDSHKNISGTVHLKMWTSMGPQNFSGQIGRHAFANTSEVPTIAGCEFGETVCGELGGGEQGQPLSFRGIKQFAAGMLLTPGEEEAAFFKIKCPLPSRPKTNCPSYNGCSLSGLHLQALVARRVIHPLR